MKVSIDTIRRITVKRELCPCRAFQEFEDIDMKAPVFDPVFEPCPKHRKGVSGKVIFEDLRGIIGSEVEQRRSKATLAIAEANADTRTPVSAPISEGAESETHTSIKVGSKVVRPGARPSPQAGIRRAATPTTASAVMATKKAEASTGGNNPIDAELTGVADENPAITAVLVDAKGGLLGPEEDDVTEDRSR